MAFDTKSGGGGGGPMADINVTPLVDVMLVLLIIFIVAAPMVVRPLSANLPLSSPVERQNDAVRLEVDIAGDGSYRLGQRVLDDSALWLRLEAAAADPHSVLVVRAQPDANYQRLATLLAEADRRGIDNINVAQP